MIKITDLKDEKGAGKYGTCTSCGKGSDEDSLMRRIRIGHDGSSVSVCLCETCYQSLGCLIF